jgi:hypothetical protein
MIPSTGLGEVIKREQDSLAAETRLAGCPPFVAVNNLEDVTRYPSQLRHNHPATVQALSGSKGTAFIVESPSLKGDALWVGTENNHYRDDYLAFLNARHGLKLSTIPKPFDVDHLYNRERAMIYGLRFVRTALVGRSANRSHGAAYEKDLTRNEALRQRRDQKLMDAVSCMKYFGFLSPLRDDPREDEIQAYLAFAATKLGLDPMAERESILYLRQKASTPWASK